MNLIIGASGKLGSRIAGKLLQNGKAVRAVSRNPEKLSMLKSKDAEVVRGDLRHPSWMNDALREIRHVFIASHALVPPSRTNNMDTVDDEGNRHLIDAAKNAGVERIFFTSVYFAKPDAPDSRNAVKTIGGPDVLSRIQVLEIVERLVGKKAKRSHVPVAMLKIIRVITRPINPGLSYLLDVTLAEENPSHTDEWAPSRLDWTGPTTVEDVVSRWVEGNYGR